MAGANDLRVGIPYVLALFLGISPALAADLPIVARKLTILDKLTALSTAKAVFTAKDPAIAKGAGIDPTQIAASLSVRHDSVAGSFDMPAGSGWVDNTISVAKFLNATAPSGGAVKLGLVKPGELIKVVARGLGDTPIDISTEPDGWVYAAFTIANGLETMRHCTKFELCLHRSVAAGTGHKLVCKVSLPDACCTADNRFTETGSTVVDACTGLEWEKKDGADDADPGDDVVNPANPHDVDNTYFWSGVCSLDTSVQCQPNASAVVTCGASTGGAVGCDECGVGEGTCITPGAVSTVWDWLNQVNDSGFAGHSDWRVPNVVELESIVESLRQPSIFPEFGPTAPHAYWSAITHEVFGDSAYYVQFAGSGLVGAGSKHQASRVRAVR